MVAGGQCAEKNCSSATHSEVTVKSMEILLTTAISDITCNWQKRTIFKHKPDL